MREYVIEVTFYVKPFSVFTVVHSSVAYDSLSIEERHNYFGLFQCNIYFVFWIMERVIVTGIGGYECLAVSLSSIIRVLDKFTNLFIYSIRYADHSSITSI